MMAWTVITARSLEGEPIVEFWYAVADNPTAAARTVLEELGVYDGHAVVAVYTGTCANHCEAFQDGAGRVYTSDPARGVWLPKDV